jgi:tRNA threonylcarbamoyl adenosine modification protein YeaZ/ribosomal-protein-alanine acetyltransferase
MKILSLDTAMAACSAAIIDTESPKPLAEAYAAMERGHAEALPPMVAEVMAASGLSYQDIDRIAVTTGPGTFTGVRIGLAFARGLGMALDIPVVGIDSLSAIAANEPAPAPLLVVSDARNGEVYAAVFDADRKPLSGPAVSTVTASATNIPPTTLILGTAAAAVIAAAGTPSLSVSTANVLPVASRFGLRAATALPGPMPAPLYLRSPDAKPQTLPLRKFTGLHFQEVTSVAAPLLTDLHQQSFTDGWNLRAFQDLLNTPGTAAEIAIELEEPVAFIVTRSAADEAEIITIGTRPQSQRRGAARQLLAHHVQLLAAKGVRQVFLEVAASNTAAQALYRGLGFAEAGRRKAYYQHGTGAEDAIIMRRDIGA